MRILHHTFACLSGNSISCHDPVLTVNALSDAVQRFEELEICPVEFSLAMLRHGVSNDIPFTLPTFATAILKGARQQQMYSVDYVDKLKAKSKVKRAADVHDDPQEWYSDETKVVIHRAVRSFHEICILSQMLNQWFGQTMLFSQLRTVGYQHVARKVRCRVLEPGQKLWSRGDKAVTL